MKVNTGCRMDEQSLKPGDRDFVGALAAGLEVLQVFGVEYPRMTLSEVAVRANMDRAKARRFVLTLHALGFVKRVGRQFELTPKVLQLGYAYQASNQYRAVIEQYLGEITAELGESSSLGVLDGKDVVYVVRSSARHRLMAIRAQCDQNQRAFKGGGFKSPVAGFRDCGSGVGFRPALSCGAGIHQQ